MGHGPPPAVVVVPARLGGLPLTITAGLSTPFGAAAGPVSARRPEAFALAEREDAISQLARYMFHAFASRSETSHEGRLEVLTDENLDTLRWLSAKYYFIDAPSTACDEEGHSAMGQRA